MSSGIIETKPRSRGEKLLLQKPKKTPTCCGRKVSLCTCMSKNTFFTISIIVGTALLIVGLLALSGYFAPASGGSSILQQLSSAANFVATNLGSDLFTLAMFTTSLGLALTLTGIGGLCIEKCGNTPAKKTSTQSE